MLVFALKYQEALDVVTGDRDMKLRQYEMDTEEWDIAEQLCMVLKVGSLILYLSRSFTLIRSRFSRMQPSSS
jgi:hypothetical protein